MFKEGPKNNRKKDKNHSGTEAKIFGPAEGPHFPEQINQGEGPDDGHEAVGVLGVCNHQPNRKNGQQRDGVNQGLSSQTGCLGQATER